MRKCDSGECDRGESVGVRECECGGSVSVRSVRVKRGSSVSDIVSILFT